MGSYTTDDGVDVFHEGRGSGQPVLFSHGWPLAADRRRLGDDEQTVPIVAAGAKSSTIVTNATDEVHPGAPHGLSGTHEQEFDAGLLAFLAS